MKPARTQNNQRLLEQKKTEQLHQTTTVRNLLRKDLTALAPPTITKAHQAAADAVDEVDNGVAVDGVDMDVTEAHSAEDSLLVVHLLVTVLHPIEEAGEDSVITVPEAVMDRLM